MSTLVIGGISLSDWEIPERINFGGRQHAVIHKLIGGTRVIDAMGPDPTDVTWSGRFRGPSATTRAQALDAMRAAGAEVPLFYLSTFVTVVITEFRADAERFYEVPYTITCTVVSDTINDALGPIVPGLDSIVSTALSVAAAFSAGDSDSSQQSTAAAVAAVQTAVVATGTLQGAPLPALASLHGVVNTQSAALAGIAGGLDLALGSNVGIGAASGVDPAAMASWLTGQMTASQDEAVALSSKDNVDLIGKNMTLAGA